MNMMTQMKNKKIDEEKNGDETDAALQLFVRKGKGAN